MDSFTKLYEASDGNSYTRDQLALLGYTRLRVLGSSVGSPTIERSGWFWLSRAASAETVPPVRMALARWPSERRSTPDECEPCRSRRGSVGGVDSAASPGSAPSPLPRCRGRDGSVVRPLITPHDPSVIDGVDGADGSTSAMTPPTSVVSSPSSRRSRLGRRTHRERPGGRAASVGRSRARAALRLRLGSVGDCARGEAAEAGVAPPASRVRPPFLPTLCGSKCRCFSTEFPRSTTFSTTS